MTARRLSRSMLVRARAVALRTAAHLSTEIDLARVRHGSADLALFHHFVPSPSGGGHQFLRALSGELAARGLTIEENRISAGTSACLFNSFNFDFARLKRFARANVRMVHRVDGPIGVYRGFDDGTDRRITQINHALADATVFQSLYSLDKHRELGLDLRGPVVIPNAPDPSIFHEPVSREPLEGRRVRVIASSWSDNPRKGADTIAWLDSHFDSDRFEMTFVGRPPAVLERIRTIAPVPSEALAELLRGHDLFVAASLDDPCSNALLEALACGLPVAFARSGGHPELVGEGGLGFDEPAELPAVLEQLATEIELRRKAIRVTPLANVADRYLEVVKL